MSAEEPRKRKLSEDGNQAGSTTAKRERHADAAAEPVADPSSAQPGVERADRSKEDKTEEYHTDAFGRIIYNRERSRSPQRARSPSADNSDDDRQRKKGRYGSVSPRRDRRGAVGRPRSRSRDRPDPRTMSGGAGRYADRDRDRGRRDRSLSPRANKRRREGDYDRRSGDYGRDSYGYYGGMGGGYMPSPYMPMQQMPYDRRGMPMGMPMGGPRWGGPGGPPMGAPASSEGGMMTYKEFLLTEPDDITPEQALKKYEAYKVDFEERSTKKFYEQHKDQEWFQERYMPSKMAALQKELIAQAKASYVQFEKTYREDSKQFSEHDLQKDTASAAAAAPASNADAEDENHDEEEGAGAEPAPDADAKDGEQKPDVDQADAEAKPSDDTSAAAKASSERAVGKTSPALKFDNNCVYVGVFLPSVTKAQLSEVFSKVEGFRKVILSSPNSLKQWSRIAWAQFDSQDACEKAIESCNGARVAGQTLHLAPKRQGARKRNSKMAPYHTQEADRVLHDEQRAVQLIRHLDTERGIDNFLLASGGDLVSGSLEPALRRLNVALSYLREVHNFCYYCGKEFLHQEELRAQCGPVHGRARPPGSNVSTDPKSLEFAQKRDEEGKAFLQQLDERISRRLSSHAPGSVTESEAEVEEQKEKLLQPLYDQHIKELDKQKYRCDLCTKLFKAPNFVQKHITSRHTEVVTEHLKKADEEKCKANFFADPERLSLIQQGHGAYPPVGIGLRAGQKAFTPRNPRMAGGAGMGGTPGGMMWGPGPAGPYQTPSPGWRGAPMSGGASGGPYGGPMPRSAPPRPRYDDRDRDRDRDSRDYRDSDHGRDRNGSRDHTSPAPSSSSSSAAAVLPNAPGLGPMGTFPPIPPPPIRTPTGVVPAKSGVVGGPAAAPSNSRAARLMRSYVDLDTVPQQDIVVDYGLGPLTSTPAKPKQ